VLPGVMFVLYFLIQALVGQAAKPLFTGEYAVSSILLGALVPYPLLVLEMGLVEEFFFRAILQGRLSA
jgi:membrane protease YdiL (CAAX protease family)